MREAQRQEEQHRIREAQRQEEQRLIREAQAQRQEEQKERSESRRFEKRKGNHKIDEKDTRNEWIKTKKLERKKALTKRENLHTRKSHLEQNNDFLSNFAIYKHENVYCRQTIDATLGKEKYINDTDIMPLEGVNDNTLDMVIVAKMKSEQLFLSLHSRCVPLQDSKINLKEIMHKHIQLSTDINKHITLALSHISWEVFGVSNSTQTFKVYLNRQRQYSHTQLSEVVLLRKFCDALIALSSGERNTQEKTIIQTNLYCLLTILVETISDEVLRSNIDFVRVELHWDVNDLLLLVWFLFCNGEETRKVMHLICTFRLKSEDIFQTQTKSECKPVFKDSVDVVLKKLLSICRTESSKDVHQVVQEMRNSELLPCYLSNEINSLLEIVYKNLYSFGYPNKLSIHSRFRLNNYELKTSNNLCQQITDICVVVKKIKGYWPRSTQLVSLCLMIKNIDIGCLLQMNTGEGKTCTIAMYAAYLAKLGKHVDIISSSPILAQRDCAEWKRFYKEFGITVCSNLVQTKTEERFGCYQHSVVYGTVESFASDILRQEFLMEDVRSHRRFDAVIVDEVDCMLLDKGINFVYLSNEAPGMHHLEPILFMIWNEVIRHPRVRSKDCKMFYIGKAEPFHILLSRMIQISDTEDKTNPLDILNLLEMAGLSDPVQYHILDNDTIDSFKENFTKTKLLQCLSWIESSFDIGFDIFEIINESFIQLVRHSESNYTDNKYEILVVGEGLICPLFQNKDDLCELLETKIQTFFTDKRIEKDPDEPTYIIPPYLLSFATNRLPTWIRNAFLATEMKPDREYIIKKTCIVPVDYESTGVVELDSKWGDGLHQFLEMKHKKEISPMTIVTNYMSTQAFFSKYPCRIYGISGTLGSPSEILYLHNTFNLKSARIPTYYRKKNYEIPGVACACKSKWLSLIQSTVEQEITATSFRDKRAVLVVCEDINTAKEIRDSLKSLKYSSLRLYTRNDDDEEQSSEDKLYRGGDIIVATNIAGRGTDINIDDTVVNAGGLFVLVTFLPLNTRVEEQVFGRSARKGQPGSSQIILNKELLPSYWSSYDNLNDIKIT